MQSNPCATSIGAEIAVLDEKSVRPTDGTPTLGTDTAFAMSLTLRIV